jgi:hypothetical protein
LLFIFRSQFQFSMINEESDEKCKKQQVESTK